jgi:hypothetical protein
VLKEVVADYHVEVVGLIGRSAGVCDDEINPGEQFVRASYSRKRVVEGRELRVGKYISHPRSDMPFATAHVEYFRLSLMSGQSVFKEQQGGVEAAAMEFRVGILFNPVKVTFSIFVRLHNLGWL